jgi:hypothetical protein
VQGRPVPAGSADLPAGLADHDGTEARAYSPAGDLLAIVTYSAATQSWLPHKVFAQ